MDYVISCDSIFTKSGYRGIIHQILSRRINLKITSFSKKSEMKQEDSNLRTDIDLSCLKEILLDPSLSQSKNRSTAPRLFLSQYPTALL